MQYSDFLLYFKHFLRPATQDDYETFGDDERLVREHADFFSEEYADVYRDARP